MINSVNNVNFKAIYCPKTAKLSKIQKEIVEDIKQKLGDQQEKKDFLLKPEGYDKIKLYRIYGVAERQGSKKKRLTYEKKKGLGIYDKGQPFKSKESKNVFKEGLKSAANAIGIALVSSSIVFGGIYYAAKRDVANIVEKGKAAMMAKDSAQKLAKDTLQLIKK